MKELTRVWLEAASMDLESAKRLSDDAFLTPVVAFHSQQAVEKALKAILEELTGNVPKIHFEGTMLKGNIKSHTAQQLIQRWAQLHHDELRRNWLHIEQKRPLEKIEPLA